MRKLSLIGLGVVCVAFGVVWALQGFGYVGGSPMTGQTLWAVVGPVVAVVGLVLFVIGMRTPPSS